MKYLLALLLFASCKSSPRPVPPEYGGVSDIKAAQASHLVEQFIADSISLVHVGSTIDWSKPKKGDKINGGVCTQIFDGSKWVLVKPGKKKKRAKTGLDWAREIYGEPTSTILAEAEKTSDSISNTVFQKLWDSASTVITQRITYSDFSYDIETFGEYNGERIYKAFNFVDDESKVQATKDAERDKARHAIDVIKSLK